MELIIRNAPLRDESEPVDIGIDGEYIETVTSEIEGSAPVEIDAEGGLVVPAFVDAHAHLDKAFFVELADPPSEGTLPELLELTEDIKTDLTKGEVKNRIERAVRAAVANGTTTIRTHLDTGAIWEHTAVKAALEAKMELSDLVDIQTTAMPQVTSGSKSGLSDADIDRLETALEMGVDAVGGEPNKEDTDQLERDTIDEYFRLADAYDAEIDLHVDGLNSPTARTTEYIARKTIEEKMQGRVQISHVSALSYYDEWHRRDVVDLIERAELNVVTTPKEDQIVADHDTTAVTELLAADVTLSTGHNNIAGTISPFGSLDMLEPAWLLAHVAGMRTPTEGEQLLNSITDNPASALGLDAYGLAPGCKASLVVCEEESVMELLRTRRPRRAVLKNGSVVATSSLSTAVGTDAVRTL
jgi:cytosine deaminase